MPAVSKAQRIAMAIAKHSPSKLHSKNRSLLRMSKIKLGEFARITEAGLPFHVKKMAQKLKRSK